MLECIVFKPKDLELLGELELELGTQSVYV